MTTMLDRAASAAFEEMGRQEMVLTDPTTLRRLMAKRVARAVVMAIRPLSEDMAAEGIQTVSWDYPHPQEAWENIIDAILAEKPE